MLLMIAIGGHALDPPSAGLGQRDHGFARLAELLRGAAAHHRLVISHGSGPQIGARALRATEAGRPVPLDELCAELQGAIGYRLSQGLASDGVSASVTTVITRVRVAGDDPAFAKPEKPIGPVFDRSVAEDWARRFGWTMGEDRGGYRRLVASPLPVEVIELGAIRALVDSGATVICAGGGGIPVVVDEKGRLTGVDAVIDKDHSAALIARELRADALIFLTDVEAVRSDWPPPAGSWLRETTPKALRACRFAAGSMRPKVDAASDFVAGGLGFAAIGRIKDLPDLMLGRAGTIIRADA